MKAIVTTAFGKPPVTVIEERPIPAIKAGYSLVQIKAATINQLSKYIRQGDIPGLSAPLILGNEGAGVVVQSSRFAPDTRVGIYGGNKLGIAEAGLFQEFVLIEDARLFALSDALSWEAGATLSVNYLTAYRALTHAVAVQENQTIVVSGATGSVGTSVVQVAKALGIRVIALVSTAQKAQRARESGADTVICPEDEKDVPAAVRQLTDGNGADFAFDPVGGESFAVLLQSVGFRGTLVSLGFAGGNTPAFNALDLIAGEKRIVGYSLHAERDEDVAPALPELVSLADEGKLHPIIDSVVGIEGVEEGYARLASRQTMGSIVLQLNR